MFYFDFLPTGRHILNVSFVLLSFYHLLILSFAHFIICSFYHLFFLGAFGALRRRYVARLADARPLAGLALRATAPHR
jgi:hypothetical protein